MKVVSSEYLQYMLWTQIVILFCLDIQNNFGTQHVLQMLGASEKDLPVQMSSKWAPNGLENELENELQMFQWQQKFLWQQKFQWQQCSNGNKGPMATK